MAATTFLENGALDVDLAAGRATLRLAISVPSGRGYELTAQDLHVVDGRFVDGAGQSLGSHRRAVFCRLHGAPGRVSGRAGR